MKTAIIALTKNGVRLSEKIAVRLGCERFAFEKYSDRETRPFSSLGALTAELFDKYDGLIFISAVGIAVRSVAPYLRSKLTDPAVVAVDESGSFAVSLLSGHAGGANALAALVAECVGAMPVVTTATDAGGLFSPDSFAKANGLHVLEPEFAKTVAAAVVNGEPVGFFSDLPCKNLPDVFADEAEIGVCVSADEGKAPFNTTLHLVPKNVVLGVGCRKGADPSAFEGFVLSALAEAGIRPYRLAEVRTIDRKAAEPAILAFCEKRGLPLKLFSAEELMRAEGAFSRSDFVLKTVGADNVCERAAAIGGGRPIMQKRAGGGVTAAACETEAAIDFGRKEPCFT